MEVGNDRSALPGKITTRIAKGTLIIHEQAGAGGFGDPMLRSADEVREDLLDGKITAGYARKYYAMAFDSRGAFDAGATAKLREERATLSTVGRDGG
jgi:N-methylhydantoinase B